MFVPEIIIKKKQGKKLTREEIDFIVQGYTKGEIPDYQISPLLMAICFQGMDHEEIANLTDSMMHSGEVMDLSSIPGIKVDKHSTGGVGDKTSLVLGPMVAACGAKVAKLSGRGLGHTGGTIDKLESIPGFSTSLTVDQFTKQVSDIGLAIMGQTADLDPADKKLYALRDVTGTVDSIPLISSSIMSKKLATGSNAILLDVKYGSGAFCQTKEKGIELARTMVEIGKRMNVNTKAVISNMDQPLGNAIGNSLEVIEAVNTLKGNGPEDLNELCLNAGTIMLLQAKVFNNAEDAQKALKETITSGGALKKLCEFVKAQGGDESYILDTSKFEVSKNIIPVLSKQEGYISHIDTIQMGEVAMHLGAGRAKKEDSIDPSAGIIVFKKPGDHIKVGEKIADLYTNHESYENEVEDLINSYKIVDTPTSKLATIEEVVE